MLEQRERQFLLELRLRRRHHQHAIVPRGVEHQFLFGHVEQIEEFEVAIDRIDLFFVSVFMTHKERLFGEDHVLRRADKRFDVAKTVDRVGEPRELDAIIFRFFRHDDCDRRICRAARVGEHLAEAARHTVGATDRVNAGFAIRLGHRAGKSHAARHAVEFRRDEAVIGEQQVGPNDAGDILAETILTRKPDDVLGLALIEVLGDKRGRGSARATLIEAVECPIEGEQVAADLFDLRDRLGCQCKRLGTYAPRDALTVVVGPEESGRNRIVDELRLFASREIWYLGRTCHS